MKNIMMTLGSSPYGVHTYIPTGYLISMAMADFAEVRFFMEYGVCTDVRTCFPRPFVDSGHGPTHGVMDKNKGLMMRCVSSHGVLGCNWPKHRYPTAARDEACLANGCCSGQNEVIQLVLRTSHAVYTVQ